jgi:hypothetical protein
MDKYKNAHAESEESELSPPPQKMEATTEADQVKPRDTINSNRGLI